MKRIPLSVVDKKVIAVMVAIVILGGIGIAVLTFSDTNPTRALYAPQVLSEGGEPNQNQNQTGPSVPNAPPVNAAALELSIIDAVNEYRLQNNLAPLEFDPSISAVARAHSADMSARGYFAHQSPEGLTAVQRGINAGFTSCGDPESLALESEMLERKAAYEQKLSIYEAKAEQYDKLLNRYTTSALNDIHLNIQLEREYKALNQEGALLDQELLQVNQLVNEVNQRGLEGRLGEGLAENLVKVDVLTLDPISGAMTSWKNSPEHNAGMLNQWIQKTGVGVAIGGGSIYITQNFC